MPLLGSREGDVQLGGNLGPVRVRPFTDQRRRGRGDSQGLLRGDIGKGVVRHIVVALRHGGNVKNLITPLLRIPGRAARPEIRHITNDRPTIVFQPSAIVRREPVLPLRNGDIGIDVDFPFTQHMREKRESVRCHFPGPPPRDTSRP